MYEYYKANKKTKRFHNIVQKFYFGISTLYKYKHIHMYLSHLSLDIPFGTSLTLILQKLRWILPS